MENSRKQLKAYSFLVLLFAAFSLIKLTVELIVIGFDKETVALDVSPELVLAATIILFVISLILLLPQIYVGVRGLKIAKNPEAKKGHIVWAVILLAFSVFAIFTPISDIAANVNVVNNVVTLIDYALDIIVYCMYIKYANRVLKGI